MTRRELAAILDHSVLKPEADAHAIAGGIDAVRAFAIGFLCVQPCWVAVAARGLAGTAARVVSTIAFPHGCDRPEVKARAAALAVADGAAEIDMVANLGALCGGDLAAVTADIAAVVRAVSGTPVKVILETSALTEPQKRDGCRAAVDGGAAFVKTSTGFHPSGGATLADVRLLRALTPPAMRVKASGGIRTLADARAMLEAGADRLGTSASAAILSALE